MSHLIDEILADVCLDNRVGDGIFKLEEEEHMNALRDNFVSRGLKLEDAISVTNKMLEGRFPERQAYNKDGILVTFPTPKHKARALSKGTHFDKNPVPQTNSDVPTSEPPKKELPTPDQLVKNKTPEPKSIEQGGKIFDIEPMSGPKKKEPSPEPPPQINTVVSPQQKEAEKFVVKQMMGSDDSSLSSKFQPSIPENFIKEINVLRDYALSNNLNEALIFLDKYIKCN